MHPSDEELVRSAKAGDKQAFVELFKRYKDKIYAYLVRYLGNSETAQDLTVETFLGAYKGLARYEEQGHFSSWLYSIATNYAKRDFRDRPKIKELAIDEPVAEEGGQTLAELIADDKTRPDNIINKSDVENIVRTAMKGMDGKYRDVLMLCDVEGLKYDEAAKVLKTNFKTVGTRLKRARRLLYEKLKKYKGEFWGR